MLLYWESTHKEKKGKCQVLRVGGGGVGISLYTWSLLMRVGS